DGTLTRPAGALLPPDLLAATRHLAAGLRRSRTLPLIGEVRLHRLMQRGFVDDPIERIGRELTGFARFSRGLVVFCLGHRLDIGWFLVISSPVRSARKPFRSLRSEEHTSELQSRENL